ncbi:MAG: hypothetical protein KAG64_01985 [Bacteroidales bacterium]|nr:hypothetical protein [Bacteroidales bacterium]
MSKSNKRYLKRIFWTLLFTTAIIISAGISLAYLYEAEVKQFAIEKINEQTNSKIKVEKIELSFLKRFPMAALQFHNVEIMESVKTGEAGNLLKAEDIFLKFDVIDLLQSKIVLKNVEINNSKLNLIVFEDGSDNFHIFKERDTTESTYLLQHVSISVLNSELWYHNYATKQKMDLKIHETKLSGDFEEKHLDLSLVSELLIREYISEGYTMFSNKTLTTDLNISINPKTKQFEFNRGNITFNKIPFVISGNMEKPKEGVLLNVRLQAKSLSLAQIISTIPQAYKTGIEDYTFQGLLSIDANINGLIVARSTPRLQVDILLENAHIESQLFDAKMHNINMQAQYSNGKKHSLSSSAVQIKNLSFEMNDSKFQAKIKLSNFVKSKLIAEVNAEINLDELIKFTGNLFGIEKLSGTTGLNLKIAGNVLGIVGKEAINIEGLDYQASLMMKGVSIKHSISDAYYQNMVGSLSINANDIHIDPTWLEINGHRHKINGSIKNYKKWNAKPEHQKIIIRGEASISNMSYADIDQIIGGEKDSDGTFPKGVDLILKFSADSFYWDHLLAKKATGIFSLRNQTISVHNTKFQAFSGNIETQFTLNGSNNSARPFSCKGSLYGVDVTQVFTGFNNFGQDVITNTNIKGKLNSTFLLNANFDDKWNFDSETLVLESDITIKNGELNNIKELDALSNYTRIDDFSHIAFSTLENSIQIKNRTISIPNMIVKSNKMDIDLTGTHGFDNNYDYHMGVLMSDVLFNKAKENNKNEFGEVESDGYGKTKLFFHVFGKGDDIHVKYDRKGLSKKIKNDMKDDGNELKSVLNKEFGWFNKSQDKTPPDSSSRPLKDKKKEEAKKQDEGEFIFEWDEGEEEAPDTL